MADYDAGIVKNPKNITILLKRGLNRADFQDNSGALADFSAAIKVDSTSDSSAVVYQNRGHIQARLKNYKAAMADLDKAVSIYSNDETFVFRGDVKLAIKDYAGAADDFHNATYINPRNAKAYAHSSIAKNKLGDEQGSTEDFDNALKSGDGAYVYTDLAELKLSLNDAAGALGDCITAITLNSKYAGAYLQMGLTKMALNQKPEACTDFNKAVELGLKKASIIASRYCR